MRLYGRVEGGQSSVVELVGDEGLDLEDQGGTEAVARTATALLSMTWVTHSTLWQCISGVRMDWQMSSESVQKDLIWCPRALYMEMSCVTRCRFGAEDSREMVVHLTNSTGYAGSEDQLHEVDIGTD